MTWGLHVRIGPTETGACSGLGLRELARATTEQRGLTLLTDGYTISACHGRPGVYRVARGGADLRPLRSGETPENHVDVYDYTCTCAAFRYQGNCKHRRAVLSAIMDAADQLGCDDSDIGDAELAAAARLVGGL